MAAAAPQVQQANARSVGSFAVFGYGLVDGAYPARPALNWGAGACGGGAVGSGSPGLTVEFMLHPTPQCFLRGGSARLLSSSTNGAFELLLGYGGLTSVMKAQGDAEGEGELVVSFDGEGVLASDYFWQMTDPVAHDRWFHVAVVRDAASGAHGVWIDGEQQPTMRYERDGSGDGSLGGNAMLDFGELILAASNPTRLCAGIDELAVYAQALPDSLIYAHAQAALVDRVPYPTADPGGVVPHRSYPDSTNATYFDMDEFTPGTELPSPGAAYPLSPGGGGNATRCVECMSCLDQLKFAPDPAFNQTALEKYGTPFNFNWMDPWHYMAGQSIPRPLLYNVTHEMMTVLASRWRYGLMLSSTAGAQRNGSIALANAHPDWPLHAVISGERGQLVNHSLPRGCYMQDAQGRFIDLKGNAVPAGGKPNLRPMLAATAEEQGCPDDIFNADGDAIRGKSFGDLAALGLRRPFDILNSDGEVFVSLDTPAEYYNFSLDAVSHGDYLASGAPNWETFWSMWRTRLTNGWSRRIMDPLKDTVFKGTAFTMYQIQGDNPYFGNWTVTREILGPMADRAAGAENPSYYSTLDFYLQHPARWWSGAGPDHGIEWTQGVRHSEMRTGDLLFSPFLSAGWSQREEANLRPAQWLGLVKILAAWGAEWFYTGFFSLRAPFQPPENWCWQAMVPIYAQALMTQYADFFYEGKLVMSDVNTTFAMGDDGMGASPLLWAGAPNVLAVARELEGRYLITVTLQRMSNNARNLATVTNKQAGRPCAVLLPGGDSVQVIARPQGSVYVYDPAASGEARLRQLDGWHGRKHPLLWTP